MIMTHQQGEIEYWENPDKDCSTFGARMVPNGHTRRLVFGYSHDTHRLFAIPHVLVDRYRGQLVPPDNLDLAIAALFAIHNDAITEYLSAG